MKDTENFEKELDLYLEDEAEELQKSEEELKKEEEVAKKYKLFQ
jgi:hypothetical protein